MGTSSPSNQLKNSYRKVKSNFIQKYLFSLKVTEIFSKTKNRFSNTVGWETKKFVLNKLLQKLKNWIFQDLIPLN